VAEGWEQIDEIIGEKGVRYAENALHQWRIPEEKGVGGGEGILMEKVS